MNRRDALKKIGLILGGTVSLPVMNAVLSGCQPGEVSYKPRVLSQEQYDLVSEIAEMIIPETDTPGAKTAKVDEFIDMLFPP